MDATICYACCQTARCGTCTPRCQRAVPAHGSCILCLEGSASLNAACTIVSPNYLPFARALATTYKKHHPEDRFFVLLVADLPPASTFESEPFEAVLLSQIGLVDVRREAMKYDILELNTNVKPGFLAHLFATEPAVDQLVYLDPDIRVFAPLEPVFAVLSAGAAVALTPHITSPIHDSKSPSEQDLLYNGTYNLGFAAFRRSDEADRVLAWWGERCLALGFSEGRTGLFVDQKWMNLAPGMFADVAIVRDAGCNMAYWNLHERRLEHAADGGVLVASLGGEPVPLRFFHFSGVVVEDATVLSRHTDRFTIASRPDLAELFAEYTALVRSMARPAVDALPYGFDRLSDGTAVTRLARRVYAVHAARWQGQDPFDGRGLFAAYARRQRLVSGPVAATKATWKEFDARDRRVEWVHRLLRLGLRALGPNRYELLMRYLAFIAVLRHQADLLDEQQSGKRSAIVAASGVGLEKAARLDAR